MTVVQNVYHIEHIWLFFPIASNMKKICRKFGVFIYKNGWDILACKVPTFASRKICNAETWPPSLYKKKIFSFRFEYKILKFCTSSSYMCVSMWLKFQNFLRWSPGDHLMIWRGMTLLLLLVGYPSRHCRVIKRRENEVKTKKT